MDQDFDIVEDSNHRTEQVFGVVLVTALVAGAFFTGRRVAQWIKSRKTDPTTNTDES